MNGSVQANGVQVTGSMIDSMRSTKPWTKLLAVLGFIGVGFMVLFGIGFMFFANLIPNQQKTPTTFMGFFYILFAVLYFMPSLYLYKYSSSIAHFLNDSGAMHLESALSYQKSFWKFMGILALIGIVMFVLAIVAAVLIPVLAKMRMQQGV